MHGRGGAGGVVVSAPRWNIEQVAAVAPSPSSLAAAEDLTDLARWSAAGGDDRVLWGRCRGSGAEPYDTMVDHADVAWRCTCLSRRQPCKHAIALQHLAELIFEWLTEVRGDDAATVGALIGEDYQLGGRGDVPNFLRAYVQPRPRIETSASRIPRRQQRHSAT